MVFELSVKLDLFFWAGKCFYLKTTSKIFSQNKYPQVLSLNKMLVKQRDIGIVDQDKLSIY